MKGSAEKRWAEEHSRQFAEHYSTMRGFIRREVIRTNLETELAGFLQFPRRIIDIGGGQGDDARWLAAHHHEVVLVDADETALAAAHEHNYPLLDAIMPGTASEALQAYGVSSFDMVVSHGTLLYSRSPSRDLEMLASLVRPSGYLSLATAGKFGKMDRFERNGQSAALIRLMSTGKYINNLGLEAYAQLPQEINTMLKNAGMETTAWFGVRIDSDNDNRPHQDVPALHKNRLLRSEIDASRDPVRKGKGQLLHFIARKNT